jgi:hypothetical protein
MCFCPHTHVGGASAKQNLIDATLRKMRRTIKIFVFNGHVFFIDISLRTGTHIPV